MGGLSGMKDVKEGYRNSQVTVAARHDNAGASSYVKTQRDL